MCNLLCVKAQELKNTYKFDWVGDVDMNRLSSRVQGNVPGALVKVK